MNIVFIFNKIKARGFIVEEKINLTKEQILNKEFSKAIRGYNAFEVDEFLDLIVDDYALLTNLVKNLSEEIASLKKSQMKDKERIRELELLNSKLETKVNSIPSSNGITDDNYVLLKRIDSLEKFIFANGLDLSKVK